MSETQKMPETNLHELLYTLSDSDLVTLPSGASAQVREMTGNEQRNFMNRSKQLSGTAIQELLGACVETINEQSLPSNPDERTRFLLDLLSGDRATLVFQIRRHSLGSDFIFKARCPNQTCNAENDWEVDLSNSDDFPVTPYKLGSAKMVEYESKIKPGLKIQFQHLDGNAEVAILRKRNAINSLTDLEARKPQAWDGQKWQTIILSRLADRLITEMRQTVREYEGGTRTTVDLVCPKCAQSVTFDLLMQPDFMTPSVTS